MALASDHAAAAGTAAGPILDVRPSHSHDSHGSSDEEVKDIYAYGVGLHSTNAILGLSNFTKLQTLSLHGNQIERIEGLEVLQELADLNLSSNNITWMEGLSQLKNLRILNLSNNRIREIAGLQGLVALKTLVLSHNEINLLGGLSALQGLPYALQHLDLRDNVIKYLCELWILRGCFHLEEVVFQCGGYTNPVCKASAYHSTLLFVVPRLQSLDGSSCIDQAPLLNTNLLSNVPSSWTNQHYYPGLQNPINIAPKILEPFVENQNVSCNPYTRPTLVLQDSDPKATRKSLPDSGHFECHFDCLEGVPKGSCDSSSCKLQDELQKSHNYYIPNHKHDVPLCKESSEHPLVMPKRLRMPILDFKTQHGEATVFNNKFHSKDMSSNVHPQNEANNNEELDNLFTSNSSANNCRYVRFVGKNNKSALVSSQFHLPKALDQKTQTTRELATQSESVARPLSNQVSQEANFMQSNLGTITIVIDGNSSYTGIEKQNVVTTLEFSKKENEVLCLTKEKKILEDEFVTFKKLVNHEKNDGHIDDNHKSMVIRRLGLKLKGCKLELQNLRKAVAETKKVFITEVNHVEYSIIKHIVLEDAIKLSTLNTEILALKEALNSALSTCQTIGTAFNDANHQKEKAKKMLVSLTTTLDEQHNKVKIVSEMLENCAYQEIRSRRECNHLKSKLNVVCQVLKKNMDHETKDLIGVHSIFWQAQGREEAKKLSQQCTNEWHRRLVLIQTLICQILQDNANTLSTVSNLRDMMMEKMLELKNALEAIVEKERGAKELITELSFVVCAQKKKSDCMQFELDRLIANKQIDYQEVERLQTKIFRLQERSSATKQKEMEIEALKLELANVISTAEKEHRTIEEAACSRFSSLLLENEKLVAKASSLAYKLQETENTIMARTKVCNSQEAIIQQLKDELVEAKNAACISEANIKVLEENLLQRLQYEVEQKFELRNELTLQETIISDMEEELKISKSAEFEAEQACKSLQEKINDVDLLLRHVDEEINGVKTLYESREKTISLERDEALAKVTAMQKKLEAIEVAATVAMQAHFESTKLMETKEQKVNTTLLQKDILIEDMKTKILEVEAKLHSRDLALETQKAISFAKVQQLGKVLEELREVT